jgi:O-antigen/teichoic acid export membrane protein
VRELLLALGPAGWRDELLRRLLRNVGYLVSGNALSAGLGLVTLALIARALGPAGLGVLALVEAYARLADRLLRLEPWQAVIKYGAGALERGQADQFRQLVKFACALDVGGALLASLLALGGVRLLGPWFGWDAQTIEMAALFSLTIMLSLGATPTAILRLFDRFALFAALDVCLAVLRLALVALAWAAGAGLWTFLAIAILVQIGRPLLLLGLAWRELYQRGYADCLRQPLAGVTRNFAGLWDFIWWLNLSVLIRKSTRELDALLVGALLDPAAVGIYTVAKRLGDAALKVGTPLQQAVFPDIARLWARRQALRMRRTVLQVNLAAAGLAALGLAVVALDVERVLTLTVGPSFLAAGGPLLMQMLAVTLALGGIALRPALLSMDQQRALLVAVIAGSVGFYGTMLVALPTIGVIGASLGHVAFNAIWLAICLAVFQRQLRRLPAAADPAG